MRSPVAASQRPALAGPPVTTGRPSGLNEASKTVPPWPLSVQIVSPVRVSQMRASPSLLAVTTLEPSRETSTESTSSVWPASVTSRPFSVRITVEPSIDARGSRST